MLVQSHPGVVSFLYFPQSHAVKHNSSVSIIIQLRDCVQFQFNVLAQIY